MKPNTHALTGFMELLPQQQQEFDRILAIISDEYQRYGFTPLDTPIIERTETLLAKAGGETEKQIYRFTKGDNDLSLRFDLTVPLARYIAEHRSELVFPFRRSHIGKVFRGERAQHGRFREFFQCDIDVIGENNLSINYDAELPRVIFAIFKRLDFGDFLIKVNNRKILTGMMEQFGLAGQTQVIMRLIDKAEKISREDLISELKDLGIEQEKVDSLLNFIAISGMPADVIKSLRNLNFTNETFLVGVSELETVTNMMAAMDINDSNYGVDLAIARGLDYYTGTVYETYLKEYPSLGSICSGGRYDNLTSYYTNEQYPGVGVSIGLTRLFDQLTELGLVSAGRKTTADVLVIPYSGNELGNALKIADQLRGAGVNTDILLENYPLKKSFRYADKLGVKHVIVVGSEEIKTGNYTLQDMTSGVKQNAPIDEIIRTLS